ncbi:alpha-galactosidase [Actinoplanes sp. TRM 88003]|uniref:Alpha-galactosidase n=1 Tax=Paractinoplanes aksuensis TaxID=2939490 RepID=A0ABT1DT90_9ACTN|nr:alpha-galactosidase [Actinoplanes aksuensis]MCO8273733.1 alpha-galactosidase [Actinoplanes aksuensis]
MTAHLIGAPGGTGLVLVEHADRLPTVAWCGVVDPATTAADHAALTPDGLPLLPEGSHTWYGRPGLSGHRGAGEPGAWSPWFVPTSIAVTPHHATIAAADKQAGLTLRTDVETVPGGLLRLRHALTNDGPTEYQLEALDVVVPVPDRAVESLDFTGRWARERTPQRRPITDGLWLRENRRGKTGFDAATVLTAGTPGFGFAGGEVWGVHVGWSGNHRHRLERIPLGKNNPTVTALGGGELLLPGEVTLAPGATYETPWAYVGAAGDGLDGLAARFHDYLRSVPAHPGSERPVTLNVWEAVYFDHDLTVLRDLADRAARIGVERFVLDDGWFGGRRHDRAGLGDWTVAPAVWPDGLRPIIDHVREAGLQFGLWFEPEMVNADSDLFRNHPEWILATAGRTPPEERHQQILDLAQPGAYRHILDRMSAVLSEYPVDYVKWDHNRDAVDGGSGVVAGRPGIHAQTVAFYRLLDELRSRFPHVEWESCASGGGRIDLEVLQRAQRVWTSDQNDALARQAIQRWTGQLVPPEYLGAHVSSPRSHQTHRALPLDFRAGTALFGHFGIEWDLTSATDDELDALARWIELYRTHRALLHGGRTVRLDSAVENAWVYGVVAPDRSAAIVAYAQLDELPHEPPRFRLPGLSRAARYSVRRIDPAPWPEYDVPAVLLSGAALADTGLPGPPPAPQSIVVVLVTAEP